MLKLKNGSSQLPKQPVMDGLYWLWGWLPMPNWLRWIILWVGNQRFLVGVGAVVLDEQDRVLFFKHTYRPKMPWGLPGGWLKNHEHPARAIEREIREESGLTVEALHPLWATNRENLPGLDIIYLARLVGGDFRASPEVCEARFFALEDFPVTYADTPEIVGLAVESLRRIRQGI
jgi:8-oxo-dGTP diphosphatase